jgi:hypothetical protein
MIPTKRSATGRGTNRTITGIMTVEVPNPVAVPIADAASVKKLSSIVCTIIPFFADENVHRGNGA